MYVDSYAITVADRCPMVQVLQVLHGGEGGAGSEGAGGGGGGQQLRGPGGRAARLWQEHLHGISQQGQTTTVQ